MRINVSSFKPKLAHRKYEGYHVDNNKTVALDEFVSLIRQYQFSTGCSDRDVLNQMASFMTGAAFTWWKTRSTHIHSIEELENGLRTRFERQATDETSILIEFASRRQDREEDLLDYVDDMLQKLDRCSGAIPEWKAIEIIVNNANDQFNKLLASRPFSSIDQLNENTTYLMRGKLRKVVSSQPRKWEPKQNYWPKVSSAEVNENVAECELADEGDNLEPVQALVDVITRNFRPFNRLNETPRMQTQNEPARQRPNNREIRPKKGNEPVICTNCYVWGHPHTSCTEPKQARYCYSCGQPGVVQSQCEHCKDSSSKNGQAAQ